jgi:hypothetical protein
MSKVIIDDELQAKLNGLKTDVELCDPAGQLVGYVISPDEYRRLLYLRASGRHTDEDIQRLRRQTGGRPLAEIWKGLGTARSSV